MSTQTSERGPSAPLAALAFGIIVPFMIHRLLGSEMSGWMIAPVIPIVVLGVWRRSADEISPGWKFLSAVLPAAYGVIILIGIVITPFSAYQQWFDSVRAGITGGPVANIFVLVGSIFVAVLAPTMISLGILWPILVSALIAAGLASVVFQSFSYFFMFAVLVVAAFFYLSVKRLPWGKRAPVFVFSAGTATVVLIVSMILGMNAPAEGNDYVDKVLFPSLRRTVNRSFPGLPLIYSDPSYGVSFNEKRLGGTPTLSAIPIFELKGKPGETVYIRTSVYDRYDGSSWEKTEPFGAMEDVKQYFVGSRRGSEDDLLITFTSNEFKTLPTTLDTVSFSFPGRVPGIGGGNLASGVLLSKGFAAKEELIIRRSPGQGLPARGTASVSVGETLVLDAEARSIFLQLPNDIPNDLFVIADGLAEGMSTEIALLSNIQDFLSYNYSYDLAPQEIMTDEDFVYSFLFNDSGGYCVHFATTFIILARLNGIPARYATGYLAYVPSDRETVSVTGLSSHAWPEIWLEEQGWITWEATSAVVASNYDQVAGRWMFRFGLSTGRSTTRQLEGILGQQVGTSPAEEEPDYGRTRLVGILAAAAGALSLLIVAYLLAARSGGVRKIVAAFYDPRGRFYSLAGRMVRKTIRAGVPHPRETGWKEWAVETARKTSVDPDTLAEVSELIIRTSYSPEPFDPETVAVMKRIVHDTRKSYRKTG